jgi:iron complex transport system substrate-binding protein
MPDRVRRVAVQTSPQVLNAYAVGVGDRLCAVTNAVKKWPILAEADPALARVAATRAGNAQINIEELLRTRPDVCIGSELDMRPIEKMTGIPTLRISMGTEGGYFDSVRNEVAFFGAVFGKEERVRTYHGYLDDALAKIQAATGDMAAGERLKVFMAFDADHLTTYGGGTFMNEWIEAAGCLNAAGGVKSPGGKEGGLVTLSMEQILGWNPDIVVVDTGAPEDLYGKPGWSRIRAVRDGKVFRLPVGLFIWNRPACEAAVLFPVWLAASAYPERFRGFDIHGHARRFYRDVFNFDFTEDQLNRILHP